AIAVLLYVPRLGSTSATTGILWELQAITAVVVGGTALKGGAGRVLGTICGAFILELVGNIMQHGNGDAQSLDDEGDRAHTVDRDT
ncbi:hypothetical protein ACC862_37600, partial [Rhizobium ruizarguesonis]